MVGEEPAHPGLKTLGSLLAFVELQLLWHGMIVLHPLPFLSLGIYFTAQVSRV
jgi:hypothetical protein